MILSDQKVNGLGGLYSVSARVSGAIPEGPVGVTPEARRRKTLFFGRRYR
jgi:hypothetical protein